MPINVTDRLIYESSTANLNLQVNNNSANILCLVGTSAGIYNTFGGIAFQPHALNPTGWPHITSNVTGLVVYPGTSDNGAYGNGGRAYASLCSCTNDPFWTAGLEVWNNITYDRRYLMAASGSGTTGSVATLQGDIGVAPNNYYTELRWYSQNVWTLILDYLGRFYVNTTVIFYTGEARMYIRSTAGTAQILLAPTWSDSTFRNVLTYRDFSGTPVKAAFQVRNGAVQFASLSDHRLKTNVRPLTGALEQVQRLRPIRFNHINDPDGTPLTWGFLAHEVQEVYSYAVFGERDAVDPDTGKPRLQNMDAVRLVPMITAATKELRERIRTLRTRVEALQTQ